jgi:hypothetical protein
MKQARFVILICILTLFSLSYYSNAASSVNSNWESEIIETGNLYDIYPTHFSLDSKGNPHFIYGSTLTYSYFNGQSWIRKPLEINDYEKGLIALDKNDLPHIVYKQLDGKGLRHIFFDGLNWNNENIFEESVDFLTDFIIDSQNRLHVVFSKGNGEIAEFIGHLIKEDSEWKLLHITKTISGSGLGYLSKSGKLAIDSSNKIYASFTEVSTFSSSYKGYWRYSVKYKVFSEDKQDWPEYSEAIFENVFVPINFYKKGDKLFILIETYIEAFVNTITLFKNIVFCFDGKPTYPYFYNSNLGGYNDLLDQPILKIDSKGLPHLIMFGYSNLYDIGHNILLHKSIMGTQLTSDLKWYDSPVYIGPKIFLFGDLHFEVDSEDNFHISFIEGPPGTLTNFRKLLPLNNCSLKYMHGK